MKFIKIILLFLALSAPVNAITRIEVSVGGNARQTLMGFGASQPADQQRLFEIYGSNKVKSLSGRVYKDLGMNWVRLWIRVGINDTVADMKSNFYDGYIDNGYLDILRSSGATHILLAPDLGNSDDVPEESMSVHARKIARFIRDINIERGVKIEVTGIANEPGGFSSEQLSDAARFLRVELDARGLASVGIIGPESASSDDSATNAIDAMKSSSTSWKGLLGIATHSYNMGANHLVEGLIAHTGKQYWISEAGKFWESDSDEQPGNTAEASTVAARFLNDMNHSVTHWIWFIGIGDYDSHPNNDSGQVLARPDDTTGGIKYNTKYYYLKQLRAVFKTGAIFREASNPRGTDEYEKRMNWRYGQKPAITAAMAKNPGGSWGIGIVNTTGLTDDGEDAIFYPAAAYQVAVRIPVEASGLKFQVYRSTPNGIKVGEIVTTDRSGNINVMIAPRELVTLKSQ